MLRDTAAKLRLATLLLSAVALSLAACSGGEDERAQAGAGGQAAASGTGGGGGGTAGAGGIPDPGPSTFDIAGIDDNRNRLLDTYTQIRGSSDRCAFWSAMTIVEKGVFLTHTDMLGHRSCLDSACAPGSPMALDHVFKIWTINGTDTGCCTGTNCCNGGGEWHRTFFSADDALIGAFRDVNAALPLWGDSNDFAGPHAPFTQSDETVPGSPRGQIHFWSNDAEASILQRNGVVGVDDPHIVEIDNDYNILHDSNPEGYYSGTYGRVEYKINWNGTDPAKNRGDGLPTSFAGNGAPAGTTELDNDEVWSPVCVSARVEDVVSTEGAIRPGGRVTIAGTGLLDAGNTIHVRTRSMAVALDASSPLILSESPTSIEVQLPADIGTGDAYVYVTLGGGLTNLKAVTISP